MSDHPVHETPAADAAPPEDEPTTLVPAAPHAPEDEPTTIVHTDPGAGEDETTTLLAADPGAAEDEPTSIVPGAWQEPWHEPDESTTIVPTPEPAEAQPLAAEDHAPNPTAQASPSEAPGAAPIFYPTLPEPIAETAPPRNVAETDEATAIRPAQTGEPEGGETKNWFGARLQDFIAALRQDEAGQPRAPNDLQALAATARDMIARVAMQGVRPAEGWPADTVLQPDQVLANTYIVRSLIARGGVGEIYRARHRDLRTEHAIKVLLPRYALDQTVLTLMQDEARLLQTVRHEAVVGCQGFLRDADGRPMLVMDFLRGRTLSSRLREGRLPTGELITLARRLAEGLGAIHAAGLVHQDISPDNVILVEDSVAAATLIDFGLARRVGTGRDMHRNLDFAGKFSWSSPEQLSGRPAAVDARSDLYSLGLMLAAAARGYRLDMGDDLESARAARTTVPSLAGIEQPVASLLERLLAPSPAARLGAASEIGRLLDQGGATPWSKFLVWFRPMLLVFRPTFRAPGA